MVESHIWYQSISIESETPKIRTGWICPHLIVGFPSSYHCRYVDDGEEH